MCHIDDKTWLQTLLRAQLFRCALQAFATPPKWPSKLNVEVVSGMPRRLRLIDRRRCAR